MLGLLTSKTLNTIRGKALIGHANVEEIMSVFEHIDALEAQLDEEDYADAFGTEGWRHHFGVPEDTNRGK